MNWFLNRRRFIQQMASFIRHCNQLVYQFVHFFCLCKFECTNSYFLAHSFAFGDTTGISWDLWIGIITFGATVKKITRPTNGRFPLEPQVKRNPFKNVQKIQRYSLKSDTIWIRDKTKPTEKVVCTNSVGWHSQLLIGGDIKWTQIFIFLSHERKFVTKFLMKTTIWRTCIGQCIVFLMSVLGLLA